MLKKILENAEENSRKTEMIRSGVLALLTKMFNRFFIWVLQKENERKYRLITAEKKKILFPIFFDQLVGRMMVGWSNGETRVNVVILVVRNW